MKALVTGATGFLGGVATQRLARDGHQVIATGRDEKRGAALAADGVAFQPCDLLDTGRLTELALGCEVVFHCAALSSAWGPSAAFDRANVEGTRSLIEASQRAGVGRLVHISTPGLYHSGESRRDIPEDAPLPPPVNDYVRTKKLAEELVLQAHREGLPSILLRPRGIFGPGDTALLPRVVRVLATGRLPVVGDGQTLVDLTYVDNVVDGMLAAATAPSAVLGRAYNLTNGEPILLWQLLEQFTLRLDLPPIRGRVSLRTVRAVATVLELLWRVLPLRGEPPLTRYGAELLAVDMTLDISAAREALGYAPAVSMDEGVERYLAWWIGENS